jgi:hypothetical protein
LPTEKEREIEVDTEREKKDIKIFGGSKRDQELVLSHWLRGQAEQFFNF